MVNYNIIGEWDTSFEVTLMVGRYVLGLSQSKSLNSVNCLLISLDDLRNGHWETECARFLSLGIVG